MKRLVPTLLASSALLIGAGTAQAALPNAATLYKNPQCGCCDEYARQLEALGVEVAIVDDVPIGQVKERVGLPYGLGSCHTIEMGEYVIEGHVPFAAVERLFEEQPDTDGIGLAGMPIGTPGMPGPKQDDWNVYQFRAGEAQPYMTL
ncbi:MULTISPECIES: DUF411 domain-containing protein [Halomonadaceae]|uniref:DUF411 domain-containing protein n=2 Tax=Halomonadaceae TaxID=28256 RepID=A0ABZ0Y7K5_9GAMM|nr:MULTISPECIES: DUF411 domain-containing protein [Halomonadaceae]NVN55267.1 hypothetical protein [bacterium Scap17]MCK0770081.1 hypothetical protein [Chromohalobacter canadensis]MCO7234122.1 hypothetical protein [Cobetia sp. Dlab-2-AX]MCO7237389.1 hypothetical protein [Cobetia sp. Dlab-2-U]QFT84162.1 hypothetical protein FIU88_04140 [Halomonas sp. THAF12]